MRPHPGALPHYLFVCCQERAGGPAACGQRGARILLALCAALDESPAGDAFEPVACGCLGLCAVAPGVVCDPASGRAWVGVDARDATALVAALGGGTGAQAPARRGRSAER